MIFYEIRLEYELAQIKRNFSNLITEKHVVAPDLDTQWIHKIDWWEINAQVTGMHDETIIWKKLQNHPWI